MVGDFTELAIRSNDGVDNLISLYIAEKNHHNTPILLCMPAMGVSARYYQAFAQALHAQGLSAATFDLRGHGQSSLRASRHCDFGYHDILKHDLPAAINTLREHLPDQPLYLLGHSLGGQLSALYMSQHPDQAKGLILTASCMVYYRGWPFPRSWGLLFFTQLALLITLIIGHFPGKKLGFAGREALGMMRDWASNARNGTYRLRNSRIDYDSGLGKLDTPVLAVNFDDDDFSPISATKTLLNKLSHCQHTYLSITGEELGLQSADHFNWLRSPNAVAERIATWLSKQA